MFNNQIYFNWGYHDAAADAKHERGHKWLSQSHKNEFYLAGYNAGYADAVTGIYNEDSSNAWEIFSQ